MLLIDGRQTRTNAYVVKMCSHACASLASAVRLVVILFQQLVASLQISSCVESDFHLVLVQLDASLLLRGARSPRDRLVASLNCNKSCGVSGCVDVLKPSKTM